MYKLLIRRILFQFTAETAHQITFGLLKLGSAIPGCKWLVGKFCSVEDPKLARDVFGIRFPNPVGLAAGLDKDAEAFDMLGKLGFGFVEIGTITPKAQPGNPLPRLFRLIPDAAIINRMGFNNKGVDFAVKKLKRRNTNVIVGGNIGKNKLTPNELAVDDYVICFEALFDFVDYFVVNVSSPNTPNLRELQDKEPLSKLLLRLMELNNRKESPKPLLLKIAPDLTDSQLDDIVDIVEMTKIHGLVATNTTIGRNDLLASEGRISEIGAGGLSGKPLSKRATEVIRYLHTKSEGRFPIIAVGGIFSATDALEKLDAGASLVQVYTGFIYEGPSLIARINKALLAGSK
jgi:dihydroorotate dehydrogenase